MESFNLNEQHSFFTTSDGVRLHYIHLGQGEPLILLHGWGGMLSLITIILKN